MPFFDWLNDDEENQRRRERKGQGPAGPTPPPKDETPVTFNQEKVKYDTGLPDTGGVKPFEGMISPERSAQLQKRNAVESDVKNRAIKLVERALRARGLNPKEQLPAIFGSTGNEATGPIFNARLGGISQAAKNIVSQLETGRIGIADLGPYSREIQELAQQESDALRVEEQTPQTPYVPGPEKLADVQAKVLKAQSDLPYAVLPEQQKALKTTIDSGLKILDAAKKHQDTSIPPAPTPEDRAFEEQKQKTADLAAKKEAIKTEPRGGLEDIDSVWRTLSPDPEELAKKSLKMYTKLAEYLPIDPLTKVSFAVGLSHYVGILGQEATQKVLGPMAMAHKMAGEATKRGEEQAGKAEATAAALREEQKGIWKQKDEIFQEMASLEPLQTPLGIIAFILTSMLVGPSTAALIFVRSGRKGILQNKMSQLGEQLHNLQYREKQAIDLADSSRERAAKSGETFLQQGAEEESKQAFHKKSRAYEHFMDWQKLKKEYELREKLEEKRGGKKDPEGESWMNQLRQIGLESGRASDKATKWANLANQAYDDKTKKKYLDAAALAQRQADEADDQYQKIKAYYLKWHLRKYGTAPTDADAETAPATTE